MFSYFLRILPLPRMPAAGLEPARGCPRQILSLMRLPFRHAGTSMQRSYCSTRNRFWQVVFFLFFSQSTIESKFDK